MKIKNIYNLAIGVFSLLVASQCFVSCSDEPDAENYYTFTGEMVSDYLDNRPELYSDFTEILHRSGMYGMMATYGTYTCLAPTNDAVEQYLRQRGYNSVSDLSKEECDTLSWNHIIAETYFTTDLSDGNIPTANMNERFLTFSCDSDAMNGGNVMYYINMASKLIVRDDSVENGVVHTLDRVIQPSSSYLPEILLEDNNISLFTSALTLTGLNDSLYEYIDNNYSVSVDSINKGIIFHRTGANYVMYYPATRMKRFTALVETNKVFANAGIYNLDDLKAYAKQVYDEVYPEDAGQYDDDWTNRKNPLNRFIAYHLLPYYGAINDFTISESGIDYKTTCAMPNLIDCTDWYTTMMPGTIMKMSSPSEGLFINRKGVAANYSVRGTMVYTPTDMKTIHDQELAEAGLPVDTLNQQALNGIYHYIDGVLTYNTQTRDVVFNDRIRWDVITMSTEFLNAGARGNTNGNHLTGFKQVEGWDFHGSIPTLALRERGVWMATYSDAVDLIGQFDVSFKLPPVPANTYEIRFAYGAGNDRGVVQIYFGEKDNMQPMGLPIDFRIWGGDPSIGWVADTDDAEENRAIDKAMHNRGYMKDMDSWNQGGSNNLRANNGKYRKILTTQALDPNKEYWLRIKLVIENSEAELPINYFEFCPKSVYAGLTAEDTH
ncbi:MAG: fasciclin domain-containing protein [Bacteroidaceae bacterium]|nr:fasciclin domain-containing protein [Bacteroidaceae bacterium]MBR1519752.1 fasciclin domain-containing protein [Bacteroidaceae bacterium]